MPSHSQVERIGHRGAPNERLENTMPSFLRAVELGATGVELDVHVTADGVPVVHHDPTLPSGVVPKRLAGSALADLGSEEVAAARLKTGDRIPTLREVLEALTPATKVYVEIKGGSVEVIAKVVLPFEEWIAVHSFDHDAIVEMRGILPVVARGILVEKATKDLAAMVRRTGASDVWPAYKLVDEAFMGQARDCGVRVIPWTVNSQREVQRLMDLGVSGICTNDLRLFSAK